VLGVAGLDVVGVGALVELGVDGQPGAVLVAANRVDDHLEALERLAAPVWVMKLNRRRSMRFHLLVPGGKRQTRIRRPVSSARRCSSVFHSRVRYGIYDLAEDSGRVNVGIDHALACRLLAQAPQQLGDGREMHPVTQLDHTRQFYIADPIPSASARSSSEHRARSRYCSRALRSSDWQAAARRSWSDSVPSGRACTFVYA